MRKNKLGKWLVLILSTIMVLCGCSQETHTTSTEKESTSQEEKVVQDVPQEELLSGKHHVNIVVKDKGTIAVELDADVAPISVTNFVQLAKDGFYDGNEFHRIMEDFMMQGGAPTDPTVSYQTIKGEFSENGVENPLLHTRGAISMARATKNDSGSTQFFIVHQDSPHLDGLYACFGYVTQGMEIVDDICENTLGGDSNGIIPKENRPVIETIEVVD